MVGKDFFRVIRSDSGLFWVDCAGEVVRCRARSRLKRDAVIVGDFVTLEDGAGEPVISAVSQRKNRLIRPSVANIDQIIIMVAAVPEADYALLDKSIINALRQNIVPIICLNKSDISRDQYQKITQQYHASVAEIVCSSALNDDVSEILPLLDSKLTCIAGQSAVGKSTTINALLGGNHQKTDDLSQKISRGKNTTTASEIFSVAGGYVIDTPGFSIIDVLEIDPHEINLYYAEFDDFRNDCKFSTCTHTQEPQCAVREAAQNGKISLDRYQRYQKIYTESKSAFDRRY